MNKLVNKKPLGKIAYEETEQYFDRTLKEGSPMGLLLAFTYRENIIVNSSESP